MIGDIAIVRRGVRSQYTLSISRACRMALDCIAQSGHRKACFSGMCHGRLSLMLVASTSFHWAWGGEVEWPCPALLHFLYSAAFALTDGFGVSCEGVK